MFDIHAHVLPAMDDGPRSMAESMELLQGLIADGVTHLVATPHVYPGVFDNEWSGICASFNSLCAEVDARRLPISLCFAAEVRLCSEMLDWLSAGDLPVMFGASGTDHAVLVELPDGVVPVGAEQVIRLLSREGVIPIIAHPERNRAIMENPAKAHALVNAGAMLQLTAGSVIGEFGEKAARTAAFLLESGMVHVVASDAHNMRARAPRMGRARAWLAENYGEDVAHNLTFANPWALAGRPVRKAANANGLWLRDMPERFVPVPAVPADTQTHGLKDWRATPFVQEPVAEKPFEAVRAGFGDFRKTSEARKTGEEIDAAWRLPSLQIPKPKPVQTSAPAPVKSPAPPTPEKVPERGVGNYPREFSDSMQTRIASEDHAWTERMSFEETQPAAQPLRPTDSWATSSGDDVGGSDAEFQPDERISLTEFSTSRLADPLSEAGHELSAVTSPSGSAPETSAAPSVDSEVHVSAPAVAVETPSTAKLEAQSTSSGSLHVGTNRPHAMENPQAQAVILSALPVADAVDAVLISERKPRRSWLQRLLGRADEPTPTTSAPTDWPAMALETQPPLMSSPAQKPSLPSAERPSGSAQPLPKLVDVVQQPVGLSLRQFDPIDGKAET